MWDRLKSLAKSVKQEITVWKFVMKPPRCPLLAKILIGTAIAYLLIPFDLIPDIIPGIGHLDDILFVSILVVIVLKLIPKDVVEECRLRAKYL